MSDFTAPRITEKRYLAIAPTALTANGTAAGVIEVASTYCFKVGQIVLFIGGGNRQLAKVKRVISETQLIVIGVDKSVVTSDKLDMSAFLIGHTISLSEDKRPVITIDEIQRAVYAEEPTVALRSHLVDWLGRSYDTSNPMPISGLSDALAGPSVQGKLASVDTTTVVELKVGASVLDDRKVVTLQSDASFFLYFGDDSLSAPSAATVIADGFTIFASQLMTYEIKPTQPIYALAVAGTVNIRVAERS